MKAIDEITKLRELTKRLKGNPFACPVPEIKRIKNILERLKTYKG